jgi:hypothetical protein
VEARGYAQFVGKTNLRLATTPAFLGALVGHCRPGGQVIFAAPDSAAVSRSDDIRA